MATISEKGLIEILKRISHSTTGIVALFLFVVTLVFVNIGKEDWLGKAIYGLEVKYWSYLFLIIAGALVLIKIVSALRAEGLEIGRFHELLQKYEPTDDQLSDIELFLEEEMNIMNPVELAKSQLEAHEIHVIAPEPLEMWSEDVLDSTVL